MSSYIIDHDTIIIFTVYELNINEIKILIKSNKIQNIIFNSAKYEILYEILNEISLYQHIIIKSLVIFPFNINMNNPINLILNLKKLPTTLETLEIVDIDKISTIDLGIFKNLPCKLKKLKLFNCENTSLDNLPNTLEKLNISCLSHQSKLLDFLPSSLKYLKIQINDHIEQNFDYLFDNQINNQKLKFDSLPSGLESLKIEGYYQNELNCLPNSLKELHLPEEYLNIIINIPKNLEKIKIPIKFKNLEILKNCVNLKKILIGGTIKKHFQNISNFELEKIPESIKEIIFGDDFNQNIDNMPKNVKKIILGFNFKQNVIKLSDTIEYLEFGYNFNGLILKYPVNLKYLKFGRNFNQNINNLPEGLIELSIGERYLSLIKKLPLTLEMLIFDKNSEYMKDIFCIPENTHTIILSVYMEKNKINIPKNLKKITYSENNIWITQELKNKNFDGTINLLKNCNNY